MQEMLDKMSALDIFSALPERTFSISVTTTRFLCRYPLNIRHTIQQPFCMKILQNYSASCPAFCYHLETDRCYLLQELHKAFPATKRRSKVKLIRNFVRSMNLWHDKLANKQEELRATMEMLHKRFCERGSRSGKRSKRKLQDQHRLYFKSRNAFPSERHEAL